MEERVNPKMTQEIHMAHGSNFKHYLDNDNNDHPPTPRCFMMEVVFIHEDNH